MGGGYYERDVSDTYSNREEIFDHDVHVDEDTGEREVHEDLDPKGEIRECRESVEHPDVTPIVAAMDVTRSRGEDAVVIFNKMPLLIGQINMKGYCSHPVLSVAAIGDATSGDKAPIQVGQFESDARIDDNLSNIWLEEGGGGTGQESYELMAYYYARHSQLDCNKRGKKGYIFFTGDEGFYSKVSRHQVKEWLGYDIPADIPTEKIFQELQEKYHVFFIYPKKTWRERKDDIDAEIKKRVEDAGGLYEGVDIRASLLWNNRNDLDLHIIDPCGHHIYYSTHCRSNGHSPAPCGGFLDVDKNVQGETTKPVENIRWAKGKAPKGHYKVFVQNYATHGGCGCATGFRVEVEVNGEVKHFEGKTPERLTGGASDTPVYEFDYDPAERSEDDDMYKGYHDNVIKEQWEKVIPSEHILELEDPKGVVDLMLGAIAINEEGFDLDDYIVHMDGRDQTLLRQRQTRKALTGLSEETAITKVESGNLPSRVIGKKRKSGSKRL